MEAVAVTMCTAEVAETAETVEMAETVETVEMAETVETVKGMAETIANWEVGWINGNRH
jgi:hypothetical protein